jgi:hypothetical protein
MRRANVSNFDLVRLDGIGERNRFDRVAVKKFSTAWQVSESLEPP